MKHIFKTIIIFLLLSSSSYAAINQKIKSLDLIVADIDGQTQWLKLSNKVILDPVSGFDYYNLIEKFGNQIISIDNLGDNKIITLSTSQESFKLIDAFEAVHPLFLINEIDSKLTNTLVVRSYSAFEPSYIESAIKELGASCKVYPTVIKNYDLTSELAAYPRGNSGVGYDFLVVIDELEPPLNMLSLAYLFAKDRRIQTCYPMFQHIRNPIVIKSYIEPVGSPTIDEQRYFCIEIHSQHDYKINTDVLPELVPPTEESVPEDMPSFMNSPSINPGEDLYFVKNQYSIDTKYNDYDKITIIKYPFKYYKSGFFVFDPISIPVLIDGEPIILDTNHTKFTTSSVIAGEPVVDKLQPSKDLVIKEPELPVMVQHMSLGYIIFLIMTTICLVNFMFYLSIFVLNTYLPHEEPVDTNDNSDVSGLVNFTHDEWKIAYQKIYNHLVKNAEIYQRHTSTNQLYENTLTIVESAYKKDHEPGYDEIPSLKDNLEALINASKLLEE